MPITALPPAPSRATDSVSAFSSKADALLGALAGFVTETNALETNVNAKEASAASSAASALTSKTAAEGAAAASGAVAWVSGSNYLVGDARYSLVDFQTYRRKVAGAGAIDPANDLATWERVLFSGGAKAGGAQSTGSVVLTKDSPAAQVLNVTTHGKSVTLPDATTMPLKLPNLFALNNPTAFFVSVKNSEATVLGFIAPFTTVNASLADNTTAAGVWALDNAAICGISAELSVTGVNPGTALHIEAFTLDATRTMIIFGADIAVYGVVWDESTQTFGTRYALAATVTSGLWRAIAMGAGSVLFVCVTSGQLRASVLTTAGTVVTKNAETLDGNIDVADLTWLVSCGGGTYGLACYYTGPNVGAWGITVVGTTVTIAARMQIYVGSSMPSIFPTGAVGGFVVMGIDNGSAWINFKAFTVSGGAMTAGNLAASGQQTNGGVFRVVPVNGRWCVFYIENASASLYISATLFSVSGNATTVSHVNQIANSAGATNTGLAEAAAVGNKVLLVWQTGGSTLYFDLFTDTNGALSKGASNVTFGVGYTPLLGLIGISGTDAFIGFPPIGDSYGPGVYRVDCSGSSPVLTGIPDTGIAAVSTTVVTAIHTGITSRFSGSRLNGMSLVGVGAAWRIPLSANGRGAQVSALRKCVNVNTGRVIDVPVQFLNPAVNDNATGGARRMAQEAPDRVWGLSDGWRGNNYLIQRFQAAA